MISIISEISEIGGELGGTWNFFLDMIPIYNKKGEWLGQGVLASSLFVECQGASTTIISL